MLVWRLWVFESFNLLPACRRGDRFGGVACRSEGVFPFPKSPALEVWEGRVFSLPSPDLNVVVEGFSVAFQTSISTEDKVFANLSLRLSGDGPSRRGS